MSQDEREGAADEAVKDAAGQLLIALAFLVPKGTDFSDSIGPKLEAYKAAIESRQRDALARLRSEAEAGWQPMETHDGSSKSVLLRVPLDNGQNPKMTTLRGYWAKAGTQEIEMDDADPLIDEAGCWSEDAWFSESYDREPYAMLLNYQPTHWRPLPPPPTGQA